MPERNSSLEETNEKKTALKSKKPSSQKGSGRRLQDLESLHLRTNVTSNLKLSPGHRLKLDPPEQLKRKRKPIPDFDIDFADLNDSQIPKISAYDETPIDGEEDLPEAHDMFKEVSTAGFKTPPSETSYSNSDIDSLIRNIPLDDIEVISVSKVMPVRHNPGKHKNMKTSSLLTPPPLKRGSSVEVLSPPPKRRRMGEVTITARFAEVNVRLQAAI